MTRSAPVRILQCVAVAAAVGLAAVPVHGATATDKAWQAYLDGRYAISFAVIERQARAGDIEAQDRLGAIYSDGLATARNYERAAYWLEKAARGGHAAAAFTLGFLYFRGPEAFAADPARAAQWLEVAADGGHAYASYLLGQFHHDGIAVPRDREKAVIRCEFAAERGVAGAQFELAVLLAEKGDTPSLIEAYTWFTIAAARGYPGAARNKSIVGAKLSPAEIMFATAIAESWQPLED